MNDFWTLQSFCDWFFNFVTQLGDFLTFQPFPFLRGFPQLQWNSQGFKGSAGYNMQRNPFSEKSASKALKSVMFDNAAEAGTDLSLTRLKQQQQQQNRLKLIGHDGQTSLKDCTVWLWTRHMFSHRSSTVGINRSKPKVKENSKFWTEFSFAWFGSGCWLQSYRKDYLFPKQPWSIRVLFHYSLSSNIWRW